MPFFLTYSSVTFTTFLVVVSSDSLQLRPSPSGIIKRVNIATPGDITFSSTVSLPFIGPAVDTAMAQLAETYAGIFNFTQSFIYDTKSIQNQSMMPDHSDVLLSQWFYSDIPLSQWYYQRQPEADLTVLVFSGGREVANTNHLAGAWNSLMITTAATEKNQRDKQLSPTWVTTGCCSALNFAKPYLHLMRYNNWTSVYLVVDDAAPMLPVIADAVTRAIQLREGTQQTTYTVPHCGLWSVAFETIFPEFNRSSRVLFFFAHSDFLRDFMIQAYNRGMVSAEYIYIAIQPYQNTFMFGNLSWNFNDTFDQIAKEAYESVIVIAIANYINKPGPVAESHIADWKHQSRLDYGYQYGPNEQLSPHLATTYYTLLLFGQVLNETLTREPKFDLRNGASLAKCFFNRTMTIDGIPVYVDEVGERRTDMVVKQFIAETGTFEDFLKQAGDTLEVTAVTNISWYGRSHFPANEPTCGYSGTQCLVQAENGSVLRNAVVGVLVGLVLFFAIVVVSWMYRRQEAVRDMTSWWHLTPSELVLSDESFARGLRWKNAASGLAKRGNLDARVSLSYKDGMREVKFFW